MSAFKVTTRGEEVFEIDYAHKTWKRTANPLNIGNLRSLAGGFITAEQPEVGKTLGMLCAPFVPEASARLIVLETLTKVETL